MDERNAPVVGGHMRAEPVDQPVHVGEVARLARAILLAPALQLPGEIVARLAVVREAGRRDVDRVQLSEAVAHRLVDLPPAPSR